MIQGIGKWILGPACLVWLAGCVPQPIYRSAGESEPPPPLVEEPPHLVEIEKQDASPPPAVITPAVTAHPVDPAHVDTRKAYQIGEASYYGEKFHGKPTANGDIFNMYKLTAAHRVLPLGTLIKVTNLDNGRWVEVKVNDRGPFIEGRILDVSFAAALELEMVAIGKARVMIEIVEPVE